MRDNKDATLKSAVKSTLEGGIKAAFKKLGDNVTEIERDKLADEAAQRWLGRSHSDRDNTGIIAPTRALRDRINRSIRHELLAEGKIGGPAHRGAKNGAPAVDGARRPGVSGLGVRGAFPLRSLNGRSHSQHPRPHAWPRVALDRVGRPGRYR